MDGVAHPHLVMLANQVAHCRALLATCMPREQFQRQKALDQALEHLKDYVDCPDPDRAKELHRVKQAMRRAALDAGVASWGLRERANAL